jgi:hypothetical protein
VLQCSPLQQCVHACCSSSQTCACWTSSATVPAATSGWACTLMSRWCVVFFSWLCVMPACCLRSSCPAQSPPTPILPPLAHVGQLLLLRVVPCLMLCSGPSTPQRLCVWRVQCPLGSCGAGCHRVCVLVPGTLLTALAFWSAAVVSCFGVCLSCCPCPCDLAPVAEVWSSACLPDQLCVWL